MICSYEHFHAAGKIGEMIEIFQKAYELLKKRTNEFKYAGAHYSDKGTMTMHWKRNYHRMLLCSLSFIIVFSMMSVVLPPNVLGGGIKETEPTWEIRLGLSHPTPAKNQEVTLSVQVVDSHGNPGVDIPLDITLSHFSPPLEIGAMEFLDGPEPVTDGTGRYESVFNAPYFHPGDEGKYTIKAKAEPTNGPAISIDKELNVSEKKLDLRGIQIAEHAAPGTWYTIELYDMDRAPFTVSLIQNEINRTGTWSDVDWRQTGGNTGVGSTNETYEAGDHLTRLWRCEGDSETLTSKYGYPANTTLFTFLVTETSGDDIHVSIHGRIDGLNESISFAIPAIPLIRPSIAATHRPGRWFLEDSGVAGGSWQNDHLHIYGIGFGDSLKLTLTDENDGAFQYDLKSEDKVVYFKWTVPKDVSNGNHFVSMEGIDNTGTSGMGRIRFFVAREPQKIPGEETYDIRMIIGTVTILVLIAIFSTSLYTRIDRNKLLNNVTRKRIYEHIGSNPGIHFRGLLKDLDLKTGNLSYHLNVLEREEYLRSYQDGMYRRFNLYGKGQPFTISLSEIQQRIIQTITKNPGINQSNISKIIGASRIVVNYHIRILSDVGMVLIEKDGRESHCYHTQKGV